MGTKDAAKSVSKGNLVNEVLKILEIVKEDEVGLDQIEEQQEQIVVEQNPVVHLKGRGKRPDVQISEKEVLNGGGKSG